MSLEAILEAIREPGQLEVNAIMTRAEEESVQIVARARTESLQIRYAARAAATAKAARERSRIIHQAQMKAQQLVGDAQAAIIDAALANAAEQLAKMRSEPYYVTVLKALLGEAVATVEASLPDGESCYVEADPRDEQILGQLVRNHRRNISVSCTLNCWGGIIARDASKQIVAINTLEERLQRAEPSIRRALSAMIESRLPLEGA